MQSEDCFTNILKWNQNFFNKIRIAFLDSSSFKSGHFGIYFEEKNEKNKKKLEIEINVVHDQLNKALESDDIYQDLDLGIDLEYEIKKKILELHFNVENKDITAFSLDLTEVYDENPLKTLMEKVQEYEKVENLKLMNKQKMFCQNEIEIEKVKSELKEKEELCEKKKREYVYKFNLLYKEKNKKIKEFENIK